jgi:hypothetical protein
VIDIVPPLRPVEKASGRWVRDDTFRPHPNHPHGYPLERWIEMGADLSILSGVEVVEEKGKERYREPEYHLSMVQMFYNPYRVGRVDTNIARWVLAQFGLDHATEDNHLPGGQARNFWRPVAGHLVGRECPCVATEVEIRENKGDYVWRPG